MDEGRRKSVFGSGGLLTVSDGRAGSHSVLITPDVAGFTKTRIGKREPNRGRV